MVEAREGLVERVAGLGYWRAADAQVVVEALRGSGLTAAEFARRYGIRAQRLRRWARALEDGGRSEGVRFHPVRVVEHREESLPRPRSRPIEIVTRRGARVRVPRGFRAEDLERVLHVLGEGEGC